MKRLLLLLCSGCCILNIWGQIPQINGYITDSETGEALQGAIIADSTAFLYTYSNKAGFYNLGVNSGKHVILVSASGYMQQSFLLSVYNNTVLDVKLALLPVYENDTHSNVLHTVNDYRSGHIEPLASQIKNMPAIFCEQDPVKFMQYIPGINGGIEGMAGMYVRGGNADQNLVTMDGLPLYGNGHLGGFLSQLNPGQIRDIQFYRGVTPARYGGRAGAVMDVSTLDGSQGTAAGGFEADLLALKFNLNGKLNSSGTLTGSFGLRRSWIDLFLPKSGKNYFYYNFHDLNSKIVYRPNDRNKIAFWVYNGRDKLSVGTASSSKDSLTGRVEELNIKTALSWQNTLLGTNWSRKISNQMFVNFTLGMSRYTYKYPLEYGIKLFTDTSTSSADIKINDFTSITDFIGKGDFEYNVSSKTFLRFGVEAINHVFKPTQEYAKVVSNNHTRIDSTFGKVNNQSAQEVAGYFEWETSGSGGLKLNVGGRLWMFSTRDVTFVRPEPRIMLSQILEGNKALKLGFSIANQGLHQLSSVNLNLPNDVWFPVSKNFVPQQNIQLTGGFYQPWRSGIEFSADIYYKWMKGITDIKSNDEQGLKQNYWEDMVAQGKGNAYGLELLMMKKTGMLNGLVGYAYSKSQRTIADINQGVTFPFRWDRRHKLTMQGVYHVNDNLTFNFSLVLMSGHAVSVPTGKYVTADGSFVYDYSDKNNFRMPLYKRADVGFKVRKYRGNGENQYWGVNIYNFFNFKNPVFVDVGNNNQGVFGTRGISFFPFIPTVFYSMDF